MWPRWRPFVGFAVPTARAFGSLRSPRRTPVLSSFIVYPPRLQSSVSRKFTLPAAAPFPSVQLFRTIHHLAKFTKPQTLLRSTQASSSLPLPKVEVAPLQLVVIEPEYLASYSEDTIQRHLEAIRRLSPQQPLLIDVQRQSRATVELTFVGYDLSGAFSLITARTLHVVRTHLLTPLQGSLASHGLSLLSGSAFSLKAKQPHPSGGPLASIGYLVDTFTVTASESADLASFVSDTTRLFQRLARGDRDGVQEVLVEWFVGRSHIPSAASPPAPPPQLEVRPEYDAASAAVKVSVRHTPDAVEEFLYCLSTALVLRDVAIVRLALAATPHALAVDLWLVFAGQHGAQHAVDMATTLDRELRFIGLIEQFTAALRYAADPAKAMRRLNQLIDSLAEQGVAMETTAWLCDPAVQRTLSAVLGASDFLWYEYLQGRWPVFLPLVRAAARPDGATTTTQFRSELERRLLQGEIDAVYSAGAAGYLGAQRTALNAFKEREEFAVYIRNLIDQEELYRIATATHASLVDKEEELIVRFSERLTALAEVAVRYALRVAMEAALAAVVKDPEAIRRHHSNTRVALFGLGKFGGCELGYASDLELMVVYDLPTVHTGDTQQAAAFVEAAEVLEAAVTELLRMIDTRPFDVFKIDLRLRPHGNAGPLAISRSAFEGYYRMAGPGEPGGMVAYPFERQALVKLRHIAGDAALAAAILQHCDRYVYDPACRFPIAEAARMRKRQIDELTKRGKTHTKFSPGGLRDIEYLVQYKQLRYGSAPDADPALRSPTTLMAMRALLAHGHMDKDEFDAARAAYVFFRRLIDFQRVYRGDYSDLELPLPGSDESRFLARRMGLTSSEELYHAVTNHMRCTESLYEKAIAQLTEQR